MNTQDFKDQILQAFKHYLGQVTAALASNAEAKAHEWRDRNGEEALLAFAEAIRETNFQVLDLPIPGTPGAAKQ